MRTATAAWTGASWEYRKRGSESNDAQRSWGVPIFDQAKFAVEAEEERIVVRIKYLKGGTGASAPQADRLFDR
jgi:hypothetical protein